MDLNQIRDIFLGLNPLLLALACVAMSIYFLMGALRFVLILKPDMNLSLKDSVRLNFSLLLMTHALGTLSDALRVIYLTRKFNVDWRTAFSAHLSDRLLSVWLLLLTLCVFSPVYFNAPIALTSFALIPVGLAISYFISKTRIWGGWINTTFRFFHDSLAGWKRGLAQITFGFLSMVATASAIWLLSKSMDFPMHYSLALAIAPIAILASIVPFTYSGLGSREAALAYFLPMVSTTDREQALSLSLALGICYFLACLPSIVSVPKLLRERASADMGDPRNPKQAASL